MSGYTTTGSSVLADIEVVPKGVLFWRSTTHWIGGMGIIVLAIAILPLLGIGGMQLFTAEAPGPSSDKLHPRITDTAKRLWFIYVGFTLLETILLWLAGMNLFDAVNHAMSTVSTGGFSTKNASVAFWNDPTPSAIHHYRVYVYRGCEFCIELLCFNWESKAHISRRRISFYSRMILFASLMVGTILWFNVELGVSGAFEHPQVFGKAESAFFAMLFSSHRGSNYHGFVTADFTAWTPLLTLLFSV